MTGNVIDLHGTKHADVQRVIEEACSTCEIPFMVITGKSNSMKRLVADIVASFGLFARDAIDNPGRILIDEK